MTLPVVWVLQNKDTDVFIISYMQFLSNKIFQSLA